MTSQTNVPDRLWSIVLAGGEGNVLGRLFSAGWARPRPTQVCTFVDSRSMLQHTLDRADPADSA
jgi:mannose-1-phosphate guanylyltransferase